VAEVVKAYIAEKAKR